MQESNWKSIFKYSVIALTIALSNPSYLYAETIFTKVDITKKLSFAVEGIHGASSHEIYVVGGDTTSYIGHYNGSLWETKSFSDKGFKSIWFKTPENMYLASDNFVFHYDGETLKAKYDVEEKSALNQIWGLSGDQFYVVGTNGFLLSYLNGNWSESHLGETNHLNDIWGLSGTNLFIACNNGMIAHFNGESWEVENSSATAADILCLWGMSGNNIYAGTAEGELIRFDGSDWQRQTSFSASGAPDPIIDIWGDAGNNIFAASGLGNIYHYDGSSWYLMSQYEDYSFNSIWGDTQGRVTIAGESGDGKKAGIVRISKNELPENPPPSEEDKLSNQPVPQSKDEFYECFINCLF